MTLRRIVPFLGLLGALATPGLAQAQGGNGFILGFRGVEFAACVDFLMEPAMATEQLTEGYRVVQASGFGPLSPVLRREVEGDTAWGAWVPAQVCFIEAPAVTAGSKVFSYDPKAKTRELVGFWAIAASRTEGAPTSDRWFIAQYWATDWRLRKESESSYVPMTVFNRSHEPIPGTTTEEYAVTIGKTVLSWKGQMAERDSAAVSEPWTATQILDGKRLIRWTATLAFTPQWTRHLPGVFHVEGKDDLAKALKGSPIRMFGPMYWGGDARVDFTR